MSGGGGSWDNAEFPWEAACPNWSQTFRNESNSHLRAGQERQVRRLRVGLYGLPSGGDARSRSATTRLWSFHLKRFASQAITFAIDRYVEQALGSRDYLLNKPSGVR